MLAIDKAEIGRTLVALTAAAFAAAVCLFSAAGPVRAETSSLAQWQATVDRRIDQEMHIPWGAMAGRDHAVAVVRLTIDRSGAVHNVRIVGSAGRAALDKEALRVASAIEYPPLPAVESNQPRTVELQLHFNELVQRRLALGHASQAHEAHDTALGASDNANRAVR